MVIMIRRATWTKRTMSEEETEGKIKEGEEKDDEKDEEEKTPKQS